MFTGIIEVMGRVIACNLQATGLRLIVESTWEDLQPGESIAINGTCLTLLPVESTHQLQFDLSPETLQLTQLHELKSGDWVNLERAMAVGKRFGGHYVSGHVDATTQIQSMIPRGEYIEVKVGTFSPEEQRYLLPKGSITLNGVSLTINEVQNSMITLMLIPHTLAHTTFGKAQVGEKLNVEFDYIARIVAHQLGSQLGSTIISPFAKSIEASE